MKGLIYREFYLIRKTIVLTLLVYFVFVAMMSLVCISTYAGNLRDEKGVIEAFYPQAYFYAACIALAGMGYGHNDIIQKDYQSRWQLYSYTFPVSDRKIIASKFTVRGILLLAGLVLALIAEVIIAACREEDCFRSRIQLLVGKSHLELILKVADSTQALYNGDCADFPYVIRKETVEYVYNDVVKVSCDLLYHKHTFRSREAWLCLARISGNKDYHLIEELGGSCDDVEMSECYGVEASGANGYPSHSSATSSDGLQNIVTLILP